MISEELQNELQGKLEEERDQLRKQLDRLGKRTDVKSDEDYQASHIEYGDDIDENASESRDDGARDEQVAQLELRLKEVLASIDRIQSGKYGIDEKTGQEISIERLRANPAARNELSK